MAVQDRSEPRSSGIDRLIERLRDEGVEEGRARAEAIVEEAGHRARRTIEEAEREAAAILQDARADADKLRTAANDALRVAMRDAVLDLKQQLADRFAGDVGRLVAEGMRDPALLERMILEVAGRARGEAGLDGEAALEVLLPRDVVGLDELRRRPDELREGALSRFVLQATGEMLRDGVTFGRSADSAGGIRIELTETGVALDLTDRAVAGVILAHLQPRFRALLEGVVR